MQGTFVAAIVVAVLAAIATAVWIGTGRAARRSESASSSSGHDSDEPRRSSYAYGISSRRDRDTITAGNVRPWAKGVGVALWALVGLLLFVSSATIVSTKAVGIETSFGRPVGSLSNGFHMVAPWDVVTEMDAAIQTDSHTQSEGGCVTVRIAHQAVACVDVSIRWRIQDGAADSLFQNYRDFSNVRDSLVTRELNAALNAAFEGYDPLAVDENGNATAPSLNSLGAGVTKQMRTEIGNQIDVLSVIIPVLHFDPATQGRINALQAQIAQTRIAQQSEKTAEAQAQANQALAGSVSNDPNVLVDKCLNLLNDMVIKGIGIPVGFSCWPGGGSSVIVPAK